jgi:hypothetical protein
MGVYGGFGGVFWSTRRNCQLYYYKKRSLTVIGKRPKHTPTAPLHPHSPWTNQAPTQEWQNGA